MCSNWWVPFSLSALLSLSIVVALVRKFIFRSKMEKEIRVCKAGVVDIENEGPHFNEETLQRTMAALDEIEGFSFMALRDCWSTDRAALGFVLISFALILIGEVHIPFDFSLFGKWCCWVRVYAIRRGVLGGNLLNDRQRRVVLLEPKERVQFLYLEPTASSEGFYAFPQFALWLMEWLQHQKELFTAAEGMHTGQFVYCWKKANLTVGNVLPLRSVPEGAIVCNVEQHVGDRGALSELLVIMSLLLVATLIMELPGLF
eukprot:Gb_36541 [translate_table: standard]